MFLGCHSTLYTMTEFMTPVSDLTTNFSQLDNCSGRLSPELSWPDAFVVTALQSTEKGHGFFYHRGEILSVCIQHKYHVQCMILTGPYLLELFSSLLNQFSISVFFFLKVPDKVIIMIKSKEKSNNRHLRK